MATHNPPLSFQIILNLMCGTEQVRYQGPVQYRYDTLRKMDILYYFSFYASALDLYHTARYSAGMRFPLLLRYDQYLAPCSTFL